LMNWREIYSILLCGLVNERGKWRNETIEKANERKVY